MDTIVSAIVVAVVSGTELEAALVVVPIGSGDTRGTSFDSAFDWAEKPSVLGFAEDCTEASKQLPETVGGDPAGVVLGGSSRAPETIGEGLDPSPPPFGSETAFEDVSDTLEDSREGPGSCESERSLRGVLFTALGRSLMTLGGPWEALEALGGSWKTSETLKDS